MRRFFVKTILVGTNRPGSNSRKVADIIAKVYSNLDEKVDILDLQEFPFHELKGDSYGEKQSDGLQSYFQKINKAEGLIVVVPEYNGSMPGVLKYFIDYWSYPDSFEHRPVCFVGLGGIFGGLRPVEHLQQVFGYRNSFIFPDRVFLINVWKHLSKGTITDQLLLDLLISQAKGFQKFCRALQSENLDANHLIHERSLKKSFS
jgi:NAD(P)H-dependent FMN reductase